MELFGFNFDRVQVSGPQAFQDLGGWLGQADTSWLTETGRTIGNVGSALWTPVQYFLPEVRIKDPKADPNAAPGSGQPGMQTVGGIAPAAWPTGSPATLAIIGAGAVGLFLLSRMR